MERNLKQSTLYTVKSSKQKSFYDINTLIEFYQPLIGAISISIYLTLLNESTNKKGLKFPHSRLLSLLQVTKVDFLKNLLQLESLGLIKTYDDKLGQKSFFTYVLFPPLSHKQILCNENFLEFLRLRLDPIDFKILVSSYESKDFKSGEDITATFNQIFKGEQLNVETKEINILYNEELLSKLLSNYSINYLRFSLKEKKFIKNLFITYDIDYIQLASFLNQVVENNRVNEKKLNELVKSSLKSSIEKRDSKLSYLAESFEMSENQQDKFLEKLNSFKKLSPKDFAEKRLKRPIDEIEINLLEELLDEYNLSPGAVNVLVDFSILKNQKIVPKYIVKVAKTISDKKLTKPIDIVIFLSKVTKTSKIKVLKKIIEPKKENENFEDLEMTKIWEEIYGN